MSKKLEKQIEELKKRIEELESKDKTPAELPFWMPKEGEIFYYIDSEGDLCSTSYLSASPLDRERIAIGNYAETEEILEKRKAKLKLLEEIKQWRGKHDPDSFKLDWEDECVCKCELVYHSRNLEWSFEVKRQTRNPLAIYLSFDASKADFIEHFGSRLDILLGVD